MNPYTKAREIMERFGIHNPSQISDSIVTATIEACVECVPAEITDEELQNEYYTEEYKKKITAWKPGWNGSRFKYLKALEEMIKNKP